MKLTDILAISGKPGLYKISSNRDNGLIASQLGNDKKNFYSSRQHMFTPLENITVYTETDTVELLEVFKKIKLDEKGMVDLKSKNDEIRTYFTKLVPDHDKEKVYISDIKKILKWYTTLNEFGYLNAEAIEEAQDGKSKVKKTTKKASPKTAAKKMSKPKAPVKKIEKRGSQRGN